MEQRLPRHPRFVVYESWGGSKFLGEGDLTQAGGVVQPIDSLKWYETLGPPTPEERMRHTEHIIPSTEERLRAGDMHTWKLVTPRFV